MLKIQKTIDILEDNSNVTTHIKNVGEYPFTDEDKTTKGWYQEYNECAIYLNETELCAREKWLIVILHEFAHYLYDWPNSNVYLPRMRNIEEEAFCDLFAYNVLWNNVEKAAARCCKEYSGKSLQDILYTYDWKNPKIYWERIYLALNIANEQKYLKYVRKAIHD